MANAQALCTSFKTELMKGLHALGACPETRTPASKDNLKAALYLATGSKGAGTTVYDTTDEVSGSGYVAGGVAVTNATEPNSTGTTAFWTPSASIAFNGVTLATAFNAVLIYNDQFATKRAICVNTFGNQIVTAGNFQLTMPTNDATTGLIRLA